MSPARSLPAAQWNTSGWLAGSAITWSTSTNCGPALVEDEPVEVDQRHRLPLEARLLALGRVDERDVVDGRAGVAHGVVRVRVDLGGAAQVDDGAHAALVDQVLDVGRVHVGERVAAEDAPVAHRTVGRRVATEVAEIDDTRRSPEDVEESRTSPETMPR